MPQTKRREHCLFLCYFVTIVLLSIQPVFATTSTSIGFSKPLDQQVIRANGGLIFVSLDVTQHTSLQAQKSAVSFHLFVNDQLVSTSKTPTFPNVPVIRGINTLRSVVVDHLGKEIASTPIISITVLRVSRLPRA